MIDCDNFASFTGASRSKSSEEILSMIEESQTDSDNQNLFQRKGAFRKRILDEPLKKTGVSNIHTKTFERRQRSIVQNSWRKSSKGSRLPLMAVTAIWQSLKKDETDSSKKKGDTENLRKYVVNCLNECAMKFEDDFTYFSVISSWNKALPKLLEKFDVETEKQKVIEELISTEIVFIQTLELIVMLFLPSLKQLLGNLKEDGPTADELFGNIRDIYLQHRKLWNLCISLPLINPDETSQSDQTGCDDNIKQKLDVKLMKNGFLKISTMLSGYREFMQKQNNLRYLFNSYKSESTIFSDYLDWTVNYSELCRDGAMQFLSLPLQRITRYKLLLKRIQSLSEDEEEKDILESMLNSVHEFVQDINGMVGSHKTSSDVTKLLKETRIVQQPEMLTYPNELTFHFHLPTTPFGGSEIVKYTDILNKSCSPPLYKSQWSSSSSSSILMKGRSFSSASNTSASQYILNSTDRLLVHEGKLKFRNGKKSKSNREVVWFLFSDLLLICEPVTRNSTQLKIACNSPFRVDKIEVQSCHYDEVSCELCLMLFVINDFGVVSNILNFYGDIEDVKLWIEKCKSTKVQFTRDIKNSFHSTNQITREEKGEDWSTITCQSPNQIKEPKWSMGTSDYSSSSPLKSEPSEKNVPKSPKFFVPQYVSIDENAHHKDREESIDDDNYNDTQSLMKSNRKVKRQRSFSVEDFKFRSNEMEKEYPNFNQLNVHGSNEELTFL